MVNVTVNGKQLNNVQLFIFDKDGTLIDLYIYWGGMVAMRAELICQRLNLPTNPHKTALMEAMGVDTIKKRIKPQGPVGLLPRKVVQKAAEDYLTSIGQADVTAVCTECFSAADQRSHEHLAELIQPIPGLRQMISTLKKNQCTLAIATTDRTDRAVLCMQTLGLEQEFAHIIGADQVKNSKPDPEIVNLILQRTGINKAHAVMVGDAPTDIAIGHNAGLSASIGVCTGLTEKADLLKTTPYVANDISELQFTPAAQSN